ncbi:MAG: hypothetical protein PVI98_05630 [Burkholderiales bacterium]|jgi:hypothetical protein
MFKHISLVSLMLAASVAANAAPKWVQLPHSTADTSFLDQSSVIAQGDYVDVNVLRNFEDTIVLGVDPVSGAQMYSHRSVKLSYRVDCDSRKVALTGWEMYGGNFGNGEVVWANTNWGKPAFLAAVDDETRAVMTSACATNTASR